MSYWSELFAALSRDADNLDTCDTSGKTAKNGVDTSCDARGTPGIRDPAVGVGTDVTQVSTRPPAPDAKQTAGFDPTVADVTGVSEGSLAGDVGDFAELVFCDFETRNTGGCDLTKVGAWRYAADPATEVICFGYRVEGDDRFWTPDKALSFPLVAFAANPARRFACFAGFEPVVWQLIMVERHRLPPIPTERWIDVRAVCSYLALPRKLEKVLSVLGLPVAKDVAGQRFIKSLSRPNRKGVYPEITPAILRRALEYNRSDLRALEALYNALRGV
jgi:hypothetical protein